jgi:hypothetical protein
VTDYAAIYREMHAEALARFAGLSIMPHVAEIGRLIRDTGSRSLLDYGCGKGRQYADKRVHEHWRVPVPTLFDVGVAEFSGRPKGRFDGVICTDVMEHIAPEDVPAVLRDVMGFADRFVFFSIALRAAHKQLPDGRNAHLTIWPSKRWKAEIEAARPPNLLVHRVFVK